MKTKGTFYRQLVGACSVLTAVLETHSATLLWTNTFGGDWHTPANWEPNRIPASGDTAVITNSGTYTVALNGSASLASLTLGAGSGTQTLVIPSGVYFGLESDGSVIGNGVFALDGGTLDGGGTLTINNLLNWTAGAMSGGGCTVIAPGGVLNLTNAGTVTAYPRNLENGGTVICSGTGDLRCGSAVFTNRPSGIWELRSSQSLGGAGGGSNPRFDNAGVFRKSQGTGAVGIFQFANYPGGTVDIQTGMLQCNAAFDQRGTATVGSDAVLRLAAGGTATGVFETAAGGSVEWLGNYRLNAGAQLDGGGRYRIAAGAVAVDGQVQVSNLDLEATLEGTNTLTVTGVMNWTAGTMGGGGRTVIAPGALLNLSNASPVGAYPRTLENGGTVICSGAGDMRCGSAVLTNRPGGISELRSNQALWWAGGGSNPRFDNAGLFWKSQGPGTNGIFEFVNHAGAIVRVWQGALKFAGGISLSDAGTLDFGLGGTEHPTGYGRIISSQPLGLAGTLVVSFVNGHLPGLGQHYEIISTPVQQIFRTYVAPPITSYVFINPVYSQNGVQLVTTDPAPTLSAPRVDGQNRFTMQIRGIASQSYFVAASTNFVDWTPLLTNTMPADTLWTFVDEDSATLPSRFYRAVFLP